MTTKSNVREGMSVHSPTGIALGKVTACGDQSFTVEKGLFFLQDHELRYDQILDTKGNEITYRLVEGKLDTKLPAGPAAGVTAPAAAAPATFKEKWEPTELTEGKELRIPLTEEQLFVAKSTMEAGAVRIHKEVVTEERKVTVPLSHEEIVIERVPYTAGQTYKNAFEDERYTIAVHEENFKIEKKPVVREEVCVRRVTREEQRVATATVRHEEIEVEDKTTQHNGIAAASRNVLTNAGRIVAKGAYDTGPRYDAGPRKV